MNKVALEKVSYFRLKFLVVFLCSLQSYYFYQIGISPFPLLAVMLLFFIALLQKRSVISASYFKYFALMLVLVGLSLPGVFFLNNAVIISKLIFTQVGFLMVALTVLLMGVTFRRQELSKICYLLVILHLAFFYTQFFSYYFAHLRLDFLEPITGEAQRNFNGIAFRASGLFNEPATYSQFMSILMLLSLNKIINQNKIFVFFIALASIYLSMSLFGFFEATAILVLYFMRLKVRVPFWFYALSSSILIAILSYVFCEYWSDIALLLSMSHNLSASGGFDGRATSLLNYSQWIYSTESLFFGPILVSGLSQAQAVGNSLALLIVSFGLAGTVLYFLYSLKQLQSMESCLIFFIFIANAPIIQYPIFGIAWGAILMGKAQGNYNEV